MKKELWGPSSPFLIRQFSVRGSESCAPMTNNFYWTSSACGECLYVHRAITAIITYIHKQQLLINMNYEYLLIYITYEYTSLHSLYKFMCQVSPLTLDPKDIQTENVGDRDGPRWQDARHREGPQSRICRERWPHSSVFIDYLIQLFYKFKNWLPGWPSVSSALAWKKAISWRCRTQWSSRHGLWVWNAQDSDVSHPVIACPAAVTPWMTPSSHCILGGIIKRK